MKNESILAAAMMSAALPGSGHFWLGRRRLAVIEMALGLLLVCAGACRIVVVGLAALQREALPMEMAGIITRACLPWAAAVVVYSLLDGAFTYLVSRNYVAGGAPTPKDPSAPR